jgi:hypothetical protein
MNTEISTEHYVDTDMTGELDSNGLIMRYFDKDAVRNSITMWLTSFPYDILRQPNRGGYITKLLYKPMTENTKDSLKHALVDGFKQDYTPMAELVSLSVTPDYENKTWQINLSVYVNIVKDQVDVEATLKNFV